MFKNVAVQHHLAREYVCLKAHVHVVVGVDQGIVPVAKAEVVALRVGSADS